MNKFNVFISALFCFEQFKEAIIKKIIFNFSSIEEFNKADICRLMSLKIKKEIADNLIKHKNKINLKRHIEILTNRKINILLLSDKNYPLWLKQTYDPPVLLYYKGDIKALNNPLISIVGSRKYSHYGKQIATSITKYLTKKNICTVSGLALGIDTIVHQTSLNNQGKTIAVLANSLLNNKIYPKINQELAYQIIKNGLLISEIPLFSKIYKYNFLKRNRIIAGLSPTTIIVEAAQKSGALITAYNAAHNNRDIIAVPHNITSKTGKGTNALIKRGALILTSIKDLKEYLDT